MNKTVAVLVPAFNESATIGEVVSSFRKALPEAQIYVYDNNSTDNTISEATKAGAMVRSEPYQGKGNVVRRMFADIEADQYLLVDGDATYDASSASAMLRLLTEQHLDMVVGSRQSISSEAFRKGHQFGNNALNWIIGFLFHREIFTDVLSGYRAFSRRFVKSFPAVSKGFEIETELTVHALEMRIPVAEMLTPYKARPVGSESKLDTYGDGFRILWTIMSLLRINRPLRFFVGITMLLGILSLVLFFPVLTTYLETGLVPRLPTAILSAFLMLCAAISLTAGVILHSVTRNHIEIKKLQYLNCAPPDKS